jgi:hypothetical protein
MDISSNPSMGPAFDLNPIAETQTDVSPDFNATDDKINQFVKSQHNLIDRGGLSHEEVEGMKHHLQAAVKHLEGRIQKEHMADDKVERKLAKIESRIKSYINVKTRIEKHIENIAKMDLSQSKKEVLADHVRGLGGWILEHIVDGSIKTEETVSQFLGKIDSVVTRRLESAPQTNKSRQVKSTEKKTNKLSRLIAFDRGKSYVNPEVEEKSGRLVNPLLDTINRGMFDFSAAKWLMDNGVYRPELSQESKLALSRLVQEHTSFIRGAIRNGEANPNEFEDLFQEAEARVAEGMQGLALVDHYKQTFSDSLPPMTSEGRHYVMMKLDEELNKLIDAMVGTGSLHQFDLSTREEIKTELDRVKSTLETAVKQAVEFDTRMLPALKSQEDKLRESGLSETGLRHMKQFMGDAHELLFAKFNKIGVAETAINKFTAYFELEFGEVKKIENFKNEMLKLIDPADANAQQKIKQLEVDIDKMYADWEQDIIAPETFDYRFQIIKTALESPPKPKPEVVKTNRVKAPAATEDPNARLFRSVQIARKNQHEEISQATDKTNVQEQLRVFLDEEYRKEGLESLDAILKNAFSDVEVKKKLRHIDDAFAELFIKLDPDKKSL